MVHTIWKNIGNNNDRVKRGSVMNVIVRKDLVGVEMKCPSCGGHFFPTERWVYKNNKGDLVCSYHCTKVHKTKKLTGKQSMYSIAVRMADIGSKEKIAEAVMRAGFPSIVAWMESKVKELYEQTGLV